MQTKNNENGCVAIGTDFFHWLLRYVEENIVFKRFVL